MASTIVLGQKDRKKIENHYTTGSLVAARLNRNLEFVGAKAVRVYTVGTVDVNDYDRTASANRYGKPEEVGDTVQELVMSQDKSFTGIIDKGNSKDQVIDKAGRFLHVQTDEKMIPLMDTYCMKRLATLGGTIVGSGTAITAANVIARLNAGRTALKNKRVPETMRTLFVNTLVFNALVETDYFKNLDKLGAKAIAKGQVGEIFGSPVVELPDDVMPKGVNFVWVQRYAAAAPRKIEETKIHVDPPGISGNLVEGRTYYDCFVFGAKADGIYVDVTTGGGVTVLAMPTLAAATGAITAASGSTAKYTTDGSDPRYSVSAKVGTAPDVKAGDVVKAFAYREDTDAATYYNSPVAEVTVGA